MRKFLIAFASSGFILAQSWAAIAANWTTYINPRFGTGIEIPTTGFSPDPPPVNGDGLSWTSSDGKGSISAFGSFMTVTETFAEYRKWLENLAANEPVSINYSDAENNWFAYAGTRGDNIVYTKVVLSKTCNTPILNHVIVQFPISQHSTYAPIMKHLSLSLLGSSTNQTCE